MKITKNFKKYLIAAKTINKKTVIITKGGNHGKTAYVTVDIDFLLSIAEGSEYDTGIRGYWETSKRNIRIEKENGGILYTEVFKLEGGK